MILWHLAKGVSPEMLGYIPSFLSEDDPRPAREQLDSNYRQGGGWNPQPGFSMQNGELKYPGDPPLKPLAWCRLRDEVIRFYKFSYISIEQPDGSFEVCRMD